MSKPELIPSSPKPPSLLSYQATHPEINCSQFLLHMSFSNLEIHQNLLVLPPFHLSLASHPLCSVATATALTSPSFHINYCKSLLPCLPRLLLFPLQSILFIVVREISLKCKSSHAFSAQYSAVSFHCLG